MNELGFRRIMYWIENSIVLGYVFFSEKSPFEGLDT